MQNGQGVVALQFLWSNILKLIKSEMLEEINVSYFSKEAWWNWWPSLIEFTKLNYASNFKINLKWTQETLGYFKQDYETLSFEEILTLSASRS